MEFFEDFIRGSVVAVLRLLEHEVTLLRNNLVNQQLDRLPKVRVFDSAAVPESGKLLLDDVLSPDLSHPFLLELSEDDGGGGYDMMDDAGEVFEGEEELDESVDGLGVHP